MPRDFQLYINDIVRSCEKIIRYSQNVSKDEFIKDEILYDAVLRNLIIIGEAAKGLPENNRNEFKNIEWKKICGLRDIITHAYFGIDNEIIWDIIQTKIPLLYSSLTKSSPPLTPKIDKH